MSWEKRAQGEQGTSTQGVAHGHLPRGPRPWHLPGSLGCGPCRQHVRPPPAAAPAARLVSGACDPAFPQRQTRRVWQGPGSGCAAPPGALCGARLRAARRACAWPPYRPRCSVASWRGWYGPRAPASGDSPNLRHSARRTRNEGAATRPRRTAVHLERRIQPMEPPARWPADVPPFREEDRPIGVAMSPRAVCNVTSAAWRSGCSGIGDHQSSLYWRFGTWSTSTTCPCASVTIAQVGDAISFARRPPSSIRGT